jgi:hypothetical protein
MVHSRKAELPSRTSNRNPLRHSHRNHKALSKPKRRQILNPSRYPSLSNLANNNPNLVSSSSSSLNKDLRANRARFLARQANRPWLLKKLNSKLSNRLRLP